MLSDVNDLSRINDRKDSFCYLVWKNVGENVIRTWFSHLHIVRGQKIFLASMIHFMFFIKTLDLWTFSVDESFLGNPNTIYILH